MTAELNPHDHFKKFRLVHGQRATTTEVEPQQEMFLSPTRTDLDIPQFAYSEADWNKAVELAAFAGFGGADSDGLAREAVLYFRRALLKGEAGIDAGAESPTANPAACPFRYFRDA